MTALQFNLVFEGQVEPGHDQGEVRRTLEDLFDFDAEQQQGLFSGQPIILGKSMDQATAGCFQQALAGAGAITRMEAANDAPANVSVAERRQGPRRTSPDRRARLRTAAIQPDRRMRRKRRG